MNDQTRLFLAIPVVAVWPKELPPGKVLNEELRHITLVFLGNASISETVTHLEKPPFTIGPCGFCNQIAFLPSDENPRVAAGKAIFLEKEKELFAYQHMVAQALNKIEKRKFFP